MVHEIDWPVLDEGLVLEQDGNAQETDIACSVFPTVPNGEGKHFLGQLMLALTQAQIDDHEIPVMHIQFCKYAEQCKEKLAGMSPDQPLE